MEMKKINVKEASWIKQGVLPMTDDEQLEVRIEHTIPPIFDFYCKILHPFEIALNESDRLVKSLQSNKKLSLNINEKGNIHLFKTDEQGNIVNLSERQEKEELERKNRPSKSAKWRQIAEKYGLQFHPEISIYAFYDHFEMIGWPENLYFPSEGFLPRKELRGLIHAIQSYSQDQELYIYQTPQNSIYKNSLEEELILVTPKEVTTYFNQDFKGYLYGKNKDWIVLSDTDLFITLVAGSKEFIRCLNNTNLEIIICSANTRIDRWSDQINRH